MSRGLLACVALAAALGCRVDDGFLDEDVFPCSTDRDCGKGWGCVQATPYATDFCAPDCDDTCDGICTEQNGSSLCLRGCRIRGTGSASDCGGEGFECIRASAETDEGICYPVAPCDLSSDCAPGEVCLSELVAFAPGAAADRYYCVPRDVGEGCPARSQPVAVGRGAPLCLATCDPPDTRCPPSFGCLEQAAIFSDEEVLCFPGVHGVPCDDDTNCLLGRCLDTGAGNQCTLSCDEAGRLAGGCENLLSLASLVDALGFECDADAGGGADGGLCVTRSSIGFICTTPESDAYVCEDGLDCRAFLSPEGDEVRICTRDCAIDQECMGPGESLGAYCQITPRGGFCLPQVGAGESCEEDRHCLSGRCDDVGLCVGDGL